MTKTEKPTTRVVFRVSRHDPDDVFALFPCITADYSGNVMCYQHIGQHCAANYNLCIRASRPARPDEYAELAKELRKIGYRLKIVQRR